MRVQFAVNRPSTVDRSIHAITQLVTDGHTVGVSVRGGGSTSSRLAAVGIEHTVLTRLPTAASGSVLGFARLSRYARQFDPDVIVGKPTPALRTASAVAGARLVPWPEPTPGRTQSPTAGALTGDGRSTDDSYVPVAPTLRGAVARLHPNWFSPDTELRQSHSIDEQDSHAVAWFTAKASPYNSPEAGLSRRTKQRLVETLSAAGTVYVSNTDDPHPALDAERIAARPADTPQLVDGASVFVTDAAELAVSGALRGTPTVYAHMTESVESIPAAADELAAQKLVRVAIGDRETLSAVEQLVANSSREAVWERRATRLFTATGDPTADLIDRIVPTIDRTASSSEPTATLDSAESNPNRRL